MKGEREEEAESETRPETWGSSFSVIFCPVRPLLFHYIMTRQSVYRTSKLNRSRNKQANCSCTAGRHGQHLRDVLYVQFMAPTEDQTWIIHLNVVKEMPKAHLNILYSSVGVRWRKQTSIHWAFVLLRCMCYVSDSAFRCWTCLHDPEAMTCLTNRTFLLHFSVIKRFWIGGHSSSCVSTQLLQGFNTETFAPVMSKTRPNLGNLQNWRFKKLTHFFSYFRSTDVYAMDAWGCVVNIC